MSTRIQSRERIPFLQEANHPVGGERVPASMDVRPLPARLRYPTVERTLEALAPGDVLRLVEDTGADLFLRRLRKRFGKRYAFHRLSTGQVEAIVCRRNW